MQVFEKRSTGWSFFPANASLLETIVSLRNRTAKCSCVISGRAITYVFCRDLQFKGKWSLAKSYSKQNYCHACLTRLAVFLPLPSCCVGSLLRLRQVKRRYKSEFAVFQSSSRLFHLASALSNVRDLSWSWVPKSLIEVKKEIEQIENFVVACLRCMMLHELIRNDDF